MKRIVLTGLLLSAVLTGCATMSREECVAADWRIVGYQDGVAGRPADWLARHGSACTKHGRPPDLDAYVAGRERGLSIFCQPRRAYGLGVSGGGYSGVCPSRLESDFLTAYREGRGLYLLRKDIRAIEHRLTGLNLELGEIDKRLEKKQRALVAAKLPPAERHRLAEAIAGLAERRGRLAERIPYLEAERADAIDDMDAYAAAMEQRYPGLN